MTSPKVCVCAWGKSCSECRADEAAESTDYQAAREAARQIRAKIGGKSNNDMVYLIAGQVRDLLQGYYRVCGEWSTQLAEVARLEAELAKPRCTYNTCGGDDIGGYPYEKLAELRAEVARLLDLACTCVSDPCCGCAAHRTETPPPCKCGHTKVMHDPHCLCARGRLDCSCTAYEPKRSDESA